MKQELIQKQKLPEGWKWSTLGDIFIFGTKTGLKAGEGIEKGNYKFFTSSEKQIAYINQPNFNGEYLIFSTGGKAALHYVNEKFSASNDCFVIKIEDNIDTKYVFYYLKSNINILEDGFKGAGLKHISKEYLKNIKIFYPQDKKVQQQIVAKLDKQMAHVEIMKKEAEKEKEASDAYYESFTNNLIFNSKMGTLSKVSDVCREDKKQISPTSEEAKKRVYVGMEDVSSNTGVITINKFNQGNKILSNTFQFDNRHVLYGKLRPYLNKVALPSFSGRCSTELIPILPKENCKREFLALLLRTEKLIHAAMKNKTGSRMPRADMSEVMKVKFNLPSLNEQERIIKKLTYFSKDYGYLKDYGGKSFDAISLLPSSILNEVFGKYEIPNS